MRARSVEEIREALKKRGLPSGFCPVPFTTLYFEADGKVCLCREKGNRYAIGDIREQSIEEIWNGERIRGVREEFLSGKIVTCAKEIARDACNLDFDKLELISKADPAVIQTQAPIRIIPNFNGKCNLECPMCRVWKMPNGLYDSPEFWTELETRIIPHLVEIDSFSGEPFLQKDTYRLMDLVHKVNPSVKWSFTTNGNWRFTPKIRSYLERMEFRFFQFSIDTLDERTYREIRPKGRLQLLLDSFAAICEYDRERRERGLGSLNISIIFTMQRRNWRDLPAVMRLRRKSGVRHKLKCLVAPEPLSVLGLPESEKLEILDYFFANVDADDLPLISRIVGPIAQELSPVAAAGVWLEYMERIRAAPRDSARAALPAQ